MKAIRKVDLLTIGIYLFLGLVIYLLHDYRVVRQELINSGLLFFGLVGSITLFAFYYNRLRKWTIYLIWTGIALLQIVIYSLTNSNREFDNAIGGTFLDSLFYLPVLLVIFPLLRFAYRLIYKRELIVNLRRYTLGEVVENREVGWSDIIFSVIGLAFIIFGIDSVQYFLKN